MTTYATMQARIADELDDDGLTTQIKSAIQSAIAYYSRTRFWFNQVQFDFAIVADDEYFDSTDDSEIPNVLQIDSFYITDSSGTRWPLNPVSNYEISEVQNGFVKARPRAWASVRQQIRVYPIADSSYTATVEAFSRLSTLSADADTNAWMVEAEELIRQRAKRILAMDITKEPTDAQAAQALEEMALDGLLRETQLRRGQRLLRVDPALKARSQSYDIRSDT